MPFLNLVVLWITKSKSAVHTSGKVLCKGIQQDMIRMPAKGLWYVRAEYRAKAPPWEKPPINNFLGGKRVLANSSSMIACTLSTARSMSDSFSGASSSNVDRSNHAGIENPLFNVKGILGLVKQKKIEVNNFIYKSKNLINLF